MWLLFLWASHLFFHVPHIYGIFIELWASNSFVGLTKILSVLIRWPWISRFGSFVEFYGSVWVSGSPAPIGNSHSFSELTYQLRLMSIGYLPQTPTALLGTRLICGIDFPLMDNLGWLPHWMKRFMIFMLFEHVWTRCCWIPKYPKWSVAMNSDGSHAVEEAMKLFGNKAPRLLGDLGSMAWPRLNAQYVKETTQK